MDNEEIRPVHANQATMWTLSTDRKLVRLAVPPLRIVGFPKPLDVYMDFDAKTVDNARAPQHPAEPDAAAPAGAGKEKLGTSPPKRPHVAVREQDHPLDDG